MPKQQAKPVIELRQVGRTYGQDPVFWALREVSLTINDGEFVSIMGPSGSGKSTLMSILGCLDRPTIGEYILRGQNVKEYNDGALSLMRNQTIGFVFQQFNLIPRLTVMDNVLTPVLYGSIPKPRQRAQEILTSVGLGEKLKSRPNQLSGGQRQRVAIARALMMDPEVILADEPTGNLDTKSGKQVMTLLEDLHQQGKTVIVITHDAEIAAHSHRIITIRDGRIVEDNRKGTKPHQHKFKPNPHV